MQMFRASLVYSMLLLFAGMMAVIRAEDELYSTEDEDEGELDPSRIIFEDDYDADSYLSDEIEEHMEKQRAYEKELRLYTMELEELSKNETKHEAEKAVFEDLIPNLNKKSKEYEDEAKKNEEKFKAEWSELEEEESELAKKEEKLLEEEKELAQLEIRDNASADELSENVATKASMEAELKRLRAEYETFKEDLDRKMDEEVKALMAHYGTCVPVLDFIRDYLPVFEEKYTRMCYKTGKSSE